MVAGPCLRFPYGRKCFVRPRKGVIDLIPREKLWGKAVRRELRGSSFVRAAPRILSEHDCGIFIKSDILRYYTGRKNERVNWPRKKILRNAGKFIFLRFPFTLCGIIVSSV